MKYTLLFLSICCTLASLVQSHNWRDQIDNWADKVIGFLDENKDTVDNIAEIVDNVHDNANEVKEHSKIVYNYFYHIGEQLGGLIPIKNSTCITLHCSGQIAACMLDSTCRANMMCAGGCESSNTTCTFMCTESYQTPVISDLMRCMFVDHQCLSLPPPDPLNNATCRNPTTTVQTVDESLLNGDWYVIRGFNPLYDCYDCQVLTFNVQDGKIDYRALFNMIAVNKTEIWVTADMIGEDKSTPGILQMDGEENGLPDHQSWYVMYLDAETLISYYCGSVLSWHFEGLLIMSKTMTLNPAREADIQRIMAQLEITDDQICKLDPASGCKARPTFFTQ